MNLTNIRIAVKAAEKLNFTEAAQDLYMTQPAVSRAISILESDLGVALFRRDKKRGIRLTDAGQRIIAEYRKVLQHLQKAEEYAGAEKGLASGKVRIGLFTAASSYYLPPVIARIKERYPGIQFELLEGTTNEVRRWLEEYRIDLGIVVGDVSDFESIPLKKDRIVGVLVPKHPLADKAAIRLQDLQNEELIYCKGGHETALMDAFARSRIALRESITVQNGGTLARMVEEGLGIGLISSFTLSTIEHRLIVKDIEPAIYRTVSLIAPSFDEASVSVRYFVKELERFAVEREEAEQEALAGRVQPG